MKIQCIGKCYKFFNVNQGKYYTSNVGHTKFQPTVIRQKQCTLRSWFWDSVSLWISSWSWTLFTKLGTYLGATSMDCWSALGCLCYKASRWIWIWWVGSISTKLVPFSSSHMKLILTTNQNVARQKNGGPKSVLYVVHSRYETPQKFSSHLET